MLNKMYNLKTEVSFHPFPPPWSYSPFSYWLFVFRIIGKKVSRRWGGKLDFEVDCFSLNTVSGFCTNTERRRVRFFSMSDIYSTSWLLARNDEAISEKKKIDFKGAQV
jgi:hypothetical protein